MTELCLVGVLPQDPDGSDRLLAVLDAIKPDAIAIEDDAAILTPDADVRAAAAGALAVIDSRLHDADQLAFWRTRLAPEYARYSAFASAAYGGQRGIPVHFVGDGSNPLTAADSLTLAQLDAETLRGMAAYDWRSSYAQDYARARRDLEARGCIEYLVPIGEQRAFQQHERILADEIEMLMARPATARLVLVCGVAHLYCSDAQRTLYMQLGNGTARRFLTDGHGEIRDRSIPQGAPHP